MATSNATTTPTANRFHPFFCTTPHMASRLISAGFYGEQCANPWHAELQAWSFELTPQLVQAVAKYCETYGYRLPKIIERNLKALNEGGSCVS